MHSVTKTEFKKSTSLQGSVLFLFPALAGLVFVYSMFFVSAAQARVNAFASDAEIKKLRQHFEEMYPGAEKRLDIIRADVDRNAYVATMYLCEGYRRAAENLSFAFRADEQGPVIGDRYTRTQLQSLNSWRLIFQKGFLAFWNSMGGVKAFHSELRQLEWYDPKTFVGSVYLYYLLNSKGFLRATVHCFGYDRQTGMPNVAAMNRFQVAVAAADGVGNVLAQTAIGYGFGRLLGYTFSGFRYLFGLMPQSVRTVIKWGTYSGVTVGGISLGYYILRETRRAKEAAEQLEQYNAENRDALVEMKQQMFLPFRHKRLGRFVKEFELVLRRQQTAEVRGEELPADLVEKFEARVRKSILPDLKRFKADLVFLQNKKSLAKEEQQYVVLLRFAIPLLEKYAAVNQ